MAQNQAGFKKLAYRKVGAPVTFAAASSLDGLYHPDRYYVAGNPGLFSTAVGNHYTPLDFGNVSSANQKIFAFPVYFGKAGVLNEIGIHSAGSTNGASRVGLGVYAGKASKNYWQPDTLTTGVNVAVPAFNAGSPVFTTLDLAVAAGDFIWLAVVGPEIAFSPWEQGCLYVPSGSMRQHNLGLPYTKVVGNPTASSGAGPPSIQSAVGYQSAYTYTVGGGENLPATYPGSLTLVLHNYGSCPAILFRCNQT